MKLILNTKDREIFTSTADPTWHLEEPIYDYHYIKLSQCIIPNVLSSFDSNNNYISLNGTKGLMPTNKRYSTMAGCISDLNANKPTVANLTSFAFSFLDDIGVLRVTYTATANITMDANVRLGLPNSVVLTAGTNKTFDFPNIFSLQNTNVVYLCINNFATDDCRTSTGFGNIIGVIPLSGMFGDVSVYKCDDESSYIEIQGTDSITSVNLSLKDGQGNIIDMKGENYTLEFLLKK